MRRACGGGAGGGAERVQIGCRCEVEGRRRGVMQREGAEGGCRGRAEQRRRAERYLRARSGSGPDHVIRLM